MSHKSLTRGKPRWAVILVIVTMLTAFSASVAQATLGGSTFESGDGNLAVNTTGLHDWNSPIEPIVCGATIPSSGTNCGLDLVKNAADNSLGQGSKEDNPNPTVVSGQIPPSKDDLSRFYVNKEKVGTSDFLYLAWERSNLLGSAHMDFEFNQSSSLAPNGVTSVRTAGDLLIDFDFGGSGIPVLAKHTWRTTGNPAVICEASNVLPCWDKAVILGSNAEAAVNSVDVLDTNAPGAPRTLVGNQKNGVNSTFGEAGINLTASGVFPPNVCTHFGAASLKSRSSGNSFTSELKDFIAPIPVNISNCGDITIKKETSPDGATGTFSFTHDVGTNSDPQVNSPFTLSDGGSQAFLNVKAGTYTFTEAALPGFALTDLTCTGGTTSGGGTSADPLTIVLAVGDSVTCTFTNTQQLGAIKVTKQSIKTGSAGLAGAKIAIKDPDGNALAGSPFTTDANGEVCVDGLVALGNYTVQETQAPSGYTIDDATEQTVAVGASNADCSDASFSGATWTFTDTPLTDLTITVSSQDTGPGGTSSTITCVDSASAGIGNSPQTGNSATVDATDLAPGTYTCTVVVDP